MLFNHYNMHSYNTCMDSYRILHTWIHIVYYIHGFISYTTYMDSYRTLHACIHIVERPLSAHHIVSPASSHAHQSIPSLWRATLIDAWLLLSTWQVHISSITRFVFARKFAFHSTRVIICVNVMDHGYTLKIYTKYEYSILYIYIFI